MILAKGGGDINYFASCESHVKIFLNYFFSVFFLWIFKSSAVSSKTPPAVPDIYAAEKNASGKTAVN